MPKFEVAYWDLEKGSRSTKTVTAKNQASAKSQISRFVAAQKEPSLSPKKRIKFGTIKKLKPAKKAKSKGTPRNPINLGVSGRMRTPGSGGGIKAQSFKGGRPTRRLK